MDSIVAGIVLGLSVLVVLRTQTEDPDRIVAIHTLTAKSQVLLQHRVLYPVLGEKFHIIRETWLLTIIVALFGNDMSLYGFAGKFI